MWLMVALVDRMELLSRGLASFLFKLDLLLYVLGIAEVLFPVYDSG